MNEINQAARSRQRARLAEGEKPPAPRAALALAKSKTYQSAADAPATVRAYKADFDNLSAWCEAHGFRSLPAEPETVGAYLAAAGLGSHFRPQWLCRRPVAATTAAAAQELPAYEIEASPTAPMAVGGRSRRSIIRSSCVART
jgi:hypothetical protein